MSLYVKSQTIQSLMANFQESHKCVDSLVDDVSVDDDASEHVCSRFDLDDYNICF